MLRLHFAIEFPFYLLCPPLCSGSLGRHRFPSVSHARKPVVFFHNCRYKLLADGIVLLLPAPSHHAIRISFTGFCRYCRQEYLPSVGIPAFQPPFCLIPNSAICNLLDALNHCIICFRYKEQPQRYLFIIFSVSLTFYHFIQNICHTYTFLGRRTNRQL